MDKSRMTKKLFASALVACFLFTSLMGCEAQSEKNDIPADDAHEISSEVLPEQDSVVTKEENTAGDFTVHYNPETECVLQTFEDGTVVDLTELFDPDVIWATYYEGRIWYSVGSRHSINSCLIDGTDEIRHPINYDLEGRFGILGEYLYFTGSYETDVSSIIYRLPFRALLDNLTTAHERKYADETEMLCDPIDPSHIELVRETADRDSYYINSMVEFQGRLYFSELWWTTTPVYEDGSKITQERFSWIDQDGNYGIVFESPLEYEIGYEKYKGTEYVTENALYFFAVMPWAIEGESVMSMGILTGDEVEFIGLDDIEGGSYTDKFMNLLLTYEPDAELDALR